MALFDFSGEISVIYIGEWEQRQKQEKTEIKSIKLRGSNLTNAIESHSIKITITNA